MAHTFPVQDDDTDDSAALLQSSGNAGDTIKPHPAASSRAKLGLGSVYIIIISRVIGTGIFALPSHILREAGTTLLALGIWLVGAVLSYLGLQIYLEFGCMLPRSGGEKTYLEFAYPRPRWLASTMVAVWAVLGGVSGNNCIVFAKYVLAAAGREPGDDFMVKSIASLFLTAVVAAHAFFAGAAVKIQNVLGFGKLIFLAFLILTSVYLVFSPPDSEPAAEGRLSTRADEVLPDRQPSWSELSTALLRVFYAYTGLENANYVLGDVQNPAQTLKLAAPLALVTTTALYVLVNLAYFAVIPPEEMKNSGELVGALFFQRVFGPGAGKLVLSLAVALFAAGNVIVVVYSMARLTQEVARQGFLPWGAELASWKPYGPPLGGLLVHYIISLLAMVLPPSATVYTLIADTKGYYNQFFIIALCIGLAMLRKSHPMLERPYRASLICVFARLAFSCALIVAPLFPSRVLDIVTSHNLYALIALLIITLSLLYWYLFFALIPKLSGYRLIEHETVLADGSTVIKIVKDKA